MPRQNFLARESFVDATEKQARDVILTLPHHLPHVSLVSENKMINTLGFVYEHRNKAVSYNIALTILPLNDQYTRISLHATYTNGHAFYEDADMAFALHDFEGAIHAAIKGELAHYYDHSRQEKTISGFRMIRESFVALFLRKKLS